MVTVENPTIPEPHVERLPLDVAVRIPAEFHDFVHEENVFGRETWTIDLGAGERRVSSRSCSATCSTTVTVLGPDDSAKDYTFDALIEPQIEGFEFSVPNQSKTDAFAVWIRYRMQIYDSVGNSASTWTVSAYGKSQKEGARRLQGAAAGGGARDARRRRADPAADEQSDQNRRAGRRPDRRLRTRNAGGRR